jgi:hypothetical protein
MFLSGLKRLLFQVLNDEIFAEFYKSLFQNRLNLLPIG